MVVQAWWRGHVPADLTGRALAEVTRLGQRLRDADAIVRETGQARARTSGPYFFKPESFTSGFPSVALFYAHLAAARPGAGWDLAAREFITRSAAATKERPVTRPGLYSGSAGLAFTLQCMAQLDSRYAAVAARAYEQVAAQVLACHPRVGGYTDPGDLDVISGDAGVLAALLAVGDPSAAVADAIGALIHDLVILCAEDGRAEDGWGEGDCTEDDCAAGGESGSGPWLGYRGVPIGSGGDFGGWYDLGLSHGVLGAATALALALEAGHDADGLAAAVDHVRAWVTAHQIDAADGIRWPAGYLPGEDAGQQQRRMARPTWCYGGTGVARALWLIGRARRDEAQQRFALEAARSAVGQALAPGGPNGATLCHGVSGTLQTCLRFAAETGDEWLCAQIPPLAERVIACCDPGLPFLVNDERADGQWVDDPGFLVGAAGVGLALLALSAEVAPRWDRALLLS